MNKFVLTDPDKCIGCSACEVACTLAHPIGLESEDMMSPVNFKPRIKVVHGPKLSTTQQCRQCNNAPCVNVCPTNALVYSNDTVQLIEERCIGCSSCAVACPFGVMEMVTIPVKQNSTCPASASAFKTLPFKCDLCVEVKGGPACISACPTKAIRLVTAESLNEESDKKREKCAFCQFQER